MRRVQRCGFGQSCARGVRGGAQGEPRRGDGARRGGERARIAAGGGEAGAKAAAEATPAPPPPLVTAAHFRRGVQTRAALRLRRGSEEVRRTPEETATRAGSLAPKERKPTEGKDVDAATGAGSLGPRRPPRRIRAEALDESRGEGIRSVVQKEKGVERETRPIEKTGRRRWRRGEWRNFLLRRVICTSPRRTSPRAPARY